MLNFSSWDPKARKIMADLSSLSKQCGYSEMSSVLLMIVLIQNERLMLSFLLKHMQVPEKTFYQSLHQLLTTLRKGGFHGKISKNLELLLGAAQKSANEEGVPLAPIHLVWAFIFHDSMVRRVMYRFGIDKVRLREALRAYRGILGEDGTAGAAGTAETVERKPRTMLNSIGKNLCEQVRLGKIMPAVGREEEINRVLNIMARKTKNNPVLVGEPGTGKTAIVEGLARLIVDGNVPDELKNVDIYSINVADLTAGTEYRVTFEKKLKDIIHEAEAAPEEVILFIDQMHLPMCAGQGTGPSMYPAKIPKPECARGHVRIIGATT